MLIITAAAAAILQELLRRNQATGLRLVPADETPGEPGFRLSLVDGPAPGDRAAADDPPVYLPAGAGGALGDAVLDAVGDGGPADLRIVPRAA